MSINNTSVQNDCVREDLITKIKEAEKKYYNESPCFHCGPGNGCDDCRGCEDSERNYELEKMLRDAKKAYKDRFGHSYDEDLMIQQISNKEEKRDLIIAKGVKIKEWINYNIKQHGAKNFFNCVNNAWPEISESIKQSILDEISENIKPKQINTIEDLAKLLDDNEYRDELDNEYNIDVEAICRKNKWVIIFGASDDLIEFRGFIDDEGGAYHGVLMKLVKPGDFYLDDEEEETYKKSKEYMFVSINESELNEIQNNGYQNTCVVEMLWRPNDSNASWQVNSKGAPFVRFNINEDEALYCEAAIIDLNKLIS